VQTDIVHHCQFPDLTINGSKLVDGVQFNHVTEILYNAEENGKSLVCKLDCRDGVWHGPVCDGKVFKYSCPLTYISPGVEAFIEHSPLVLHRVEEFPDGANLRFRCQDASEHLDGRTVLTCMNGAWSSRQPICQKTSTIDKYSESLPPSLEWTVSGDERSRGREGEVITTPGTIIHLDCIFDRRRGTPQWSWSHNYRDYPTGWLASETERNWKFRISIVYSKEQDSGSFNCTTPRGIQNSVVVRVTSQTCPQLNTKDYHRLSSGHQHIGSNITVYCPNGFHTLGSSNLLCRDDGTWSSDLPTCIPVTCPALEISSQHLRILRLNNSYLGEAVFDCPFGYNLTGEETIWCNHLSQWSGPVPTCKAISCSSPVPPENGQMLESGIHYVGSTVQTICHSGFVLIGEPIIRCTQHGIWSDATPQCKRACSYPGTPIQGSVSPLKFIYSVGEKVRVLCDHGYVSIGENTIECTNSGAWSVELPKCESYL